MYECLKQRAQNIVTKQSCYLISIKFHGFSFHFIYHIYSLYFFFLPPPDYGFRPGPRSKLNGQLIYNLQSLELENCKRLTELPGSIGNLVNLCYLSIRFGIRIRKLPEFVKFCFLLSFKALFA